MNKILLGLNKPYPLEERKTAQIKLAFVFGLVVFMLLYFVKPFGFDGTQKQLLINSVYAGLLTTVAICFDFLMLFPLFPQFFKEEKWTIGREIIFTLIIITTIASFNVLAGKFIWGLSLSFLTWLKMILFTGIVGIAPATISILLNQARLLKKYRKEVATINEHLPHKDEKSVQFIAEENNEPIKKSVCINEQKPVLTEENTIDLLPQLITFAAENEKENIAIHPDKFLAATSADNYVKIYYKENDKVKTTIIRSTLKKAEENTSNFSNIFRCHRTALVNLTQVEKVNGTAQGYKLKLTTMVEEIPVSRNLNKELKGRLGSLTLVPSPEVEG
jgi:hypothetical protein